MYDHYSDWIVTVQSHLWMLHMNTYAISTSKEDIDVVLMVPSGTLCLLDIDLNVWALTWSLTASFSLLHPPCMFSTLFQMFSVPAVLLLFVNCVIPSVSLLACIIKRKQSLATYDCVFMCAWAIFLLLCSCDVLRWSHLNI